MGNFVTIFWPDGKTYVSESNGNGTDVNRSPESWRLLISFNYSMVSEILISLFIGLMLLLMHIANLKSIRRFTERYFPR